MLPEILYHVTDACCMKRILGEGIIPGDGGNCIIADDNLKNHLFLCDAESIPYWSVLLGKTKIIEVNIKGLSDSDFEMKSYGKYSEWYTKNAVDAVRIKETFKFISKASVMPDLCEEYIFSLSNFVLYMTKLGTYPERYRSDVNNLIHDVNSTLRIMESRLDFSSISDSYIKRKIIEFGEDGEYTLCDMYCVEDRYGKRHLWEQLPYYDFSNGVLKEVETTFIRTYEFIRNKLSWAREIETGGYAG